ncbi:mannose-6-phosphate isomerase, partial [Streptomyces beijiangensis]|nr:mannose-6-phosphate isomerase [Streptomyces beijiangensis]
MSPRRSPLTEAVVGAHGLSVPLATAPYDGHQRPEEVPESAAAPGSFWSLLTPLLILLDRVGIVTAPPETINL